jgi:hypothetical protein
VPARVASSPAAASTRRTGPQALASRNMLCGPWRLVGASSPGRRGVDGPGLRHVRLRGIFAAAATPTTSSPRSTTAPGCGSCASARRATRGPPSSSWTTCYADVFNDKLHEGEDYHNYHRPHGGLGGQTPTNASGRRPRPSRKRSSSVAQPEPAACWSRRRSSTLEPDAGARHAGSQLCPFYLIAGGYRAGAGRLRPAPMARRRPSAAHDRVCGACSCSLRWTAARRSGRLRHMLLRDVLGDGGTSYLDAVSADLEWAVVIG